MFPLGTIVSVMAGLGLEIEVLQDRGTALVGTLLTRKCVSSLPSYCSTSIFMYAAKQIEIGSSKEAGVSLSFSSFVSSDRRICLLTSDPPFV